METKGNSGKEFRELLENYEIKPSPRVWEGIVAASPAPLIKPRSYRQLWIGAAATLTLIVAVLVVWYFAVDTNENSVIDADLSAVTNTDAPAETARSQELDPAETTEEDAVERNESSEMSVSGQETIAGSSARSVPASVKPASSVAERSNQPVSSNVKSDVKPDRAQQTAINGTQKTEVRQSAKPAETSNDLYTNVPQDTPVAKASNTGTLEVFIPNAFVPNNNGINDIFIPVIQNNEEVLDYKMQIFSRTGMIYFESASADVGWDGRYLGVLVEDQVCIYVITFRDKEGYPYVRKGTVTLVK